MDTKEKEVVEVTDSVDQMSFIVVFGWIINIFAWAVFIFTDSNTYEIGMGIACLFAAMIGFFNSSDQLTKISLIDAAWMFVWGFNIFGF